MKVSKKIILDFSLVTLGIFITALGISLFFEPADIVNGGVMGLGIIILNYFPVPLWVTNAVLNVPLFFAAIRVIGLRHLWRTLYATALFSPALLLTSLLPIPEVDLLLASVFGGAICGVGLGVVFRFGSTAGGSTLLAEVIHHKLKHISVSKILSVIDSSVIFLGFLVFGPEISLYAIIAVFVCSKVMSSVLEGFSFSKAAYIISDNTDEIGDEIITKMKRGATIISGKGFYTKKEKNILLCVVSAKEIVQLKEISKRLDKNAFILVSDVREVLSDGYIVNRKD